MELRVICVAASDTDGVWRETGRKKLKEPDTLQQLQGLINRELFDGGASSSGYVMAMQKLKTTTSPYAEKERKTPKVHLTWSR
jgi:hypothetical protein